MRKFVIRVLATFFVVFLFAFGMDVFITRNLHRSDARLFQSWNDLFRGDLQCDAVVMGSSRGWVQYSPFIIDSVLGTDCYNISLDGRCIDAEVVKYKVYCQHNPKPKLIIQNVDYGTLALSNGYEREQFLPYLQDGLLFNLTKESEGFTWADRYLPLVRYAGYFQVIKEGLGLRNKLNRYPLYKGYFGRNEQWDGSAFEAIESIDFCHNPKAVEIFGDYLAQCKADDIEVIMVFAPIYIGVTQKVDDVQCVFDFYDSIAYKFGYPVLNYTFDSISYDTAYFYNASHLNKKGAELFSKKLAADLKTLL